MRPARKAMLRWQLQARPEQLPPDGDWLVWLILAGRGYGKTRTGAEWAAEKGRACRGARIALVGATFGDGRDTMVEGESGLLSVLDPSELRGGSVSTGWNRGNGELALANGSRFKVYSAEEPQRLRGPQHHFGWGDEAASWPDAWMGAQASPTKDTTWSNLLIGCRLGQRPQIVVTTTPKPVALLKARDGQPLGLIQQPSTQLTRGRTVDNLANLAPTYKTSVVDPLEGTRLGRQELDGEFIEDVDGALWSTDLLARCRMQPEQVPAAGDFLRIVVGVDPAVTAGARSDETGIVVVGHTEDRRFVVLDDRTAKLSTDEWARLVIRVFDQWEADRVVVEVNQGGDLVSQTLRVHRQNLPIEAVHATRGKRLRAEPVAALYEQDRVRHAKPFPRLEEQMTTWTPDSPSSPDALDALVWAVTALGFRGDGGGSIASPAGYSMPGRQVGARTYARR